jgi:hypothetical protein
MSAGCLPSKLSGHGPCRDHAGLCRPEGCGSGEIMNACGLLASQALGAQFSGDREGLRGGKLGGVQPWQG